jgi:hypothetical protein
MLSPQTGSRQTATSSDLATLQAAAVGSIAIHGMRPTDRYLAAVTLGTDCVGETTAGSRSVNVEPRPGSL